MKPPPKCRWKEGDLATYIRPERDGGPVPVVIGAVRMATVGFGHSQEQRLCVYFAHYATEEREKRGGRDFSEVIDYNDQRELLVKRKRAKDAA